MRAPPPGQQLRVVAATCPVMLARRGVRQPHIDPRAEDTRVASSRAQPDGLPASTTTTTPARGPAASAALNPATPAPTTTTSTVSCGSASIPGNSSSVCASARISSAQGACATGTALSLVMVAIPLDFGIEILCDEHRHGTTYVDQKTIDALIVSWRAEFARIRHTVERLLAISSNLMGLSGAKTPGILALRSVAHPERTLC